MAFLLLGLQLVSTSGCTTWSRVPPGGLPDPAPRQVQVWARDSVAVLQEPSVRSDSLVGTVTKAQGATERPTVARPLADVDSLRVRKVSATRTVLATVGIIGAFGFIVAVSGGLYGDEP